VSKAVKIILIVMFSVLLVLMLFGFNSSSSMPIGIYMRLPAWNLKVGQIVAFSNPLADGQFGVNVGSSSIIKRIVRLDGEKIYVRGEDDAAYDSRYFGYLTSSYIRFRAVPVFVFDKVPDFIKSISNLFNKGEIK